MNEKDIILNIQEISFIKSKPTEYIYNILSKSYSHKPYLAKMPYDRHTKNPFKMCARYIALDDYEKELKKEIDGFNKEFEGAMKTFQDSADTMDRLKVEKEKLEKELRGSEVEDKIWSLNEMDWDKDLAEEKDSMIDSALDNVLMDAEVAGQDPMLDEIWDSLKDTGLSDDEVYAMFWRDENGNDFDDAGHFLGLGGQYISEVYDDPLRGIRAELRESDGICSSKLSQEIDEYINKLEALDIKDDRLADRRDRAIFNLRQAQANTPEEAPPRPPSQTQEIRLRLGEALNGLDETNANYEKSKKDMVNAKRKCHERNVALYEVANEKQNCAEIFDNNSEYGSPSNKQIAIENYIKDENFRQYLNKDGTVQASALESWKTEALENGKTWYE